MLGVKIKQRHELLARIIGTKAEEDISYTHSHNLMIGATASMVTLCILEVAAYYLYNRKVSRHSYNKQVLYLFSVPPLGEDH